jgi:hypothetical protein
MASNSSVNEGTVTFTVNDTSGNILGVPAIGPVVNGGASASYSLPGKTVPSTYSIYASYKGNNFKPSNGTANLVVSKPATVVTFTSPSVTYSDSGQNIILTAQVTAANSIINEGKVTFSITDSHGSQVGVPVWGMVINGSATSAFSLPAGTPASQYRLEGDYSADNLQNSNGVGSVTVEKEATTIKVPDVISHTTGEQTITLTAMVTTADGSIVNDGTVTFAPWDYWNGSAWTGTHPITVPVKNGIATTPYTMNGIVGWTFSNATYNGGSNFQSCQEDQTDRNIGFGQPN